MARKTNYDTLSQIEKRGPFDEYPIFPPGKDPQLCLSRNIGVQPFHLICEHDTVLAQLGGEGRVEFADAAVRFFDMRQGDFVYVPAGVPHCLSAESGSIVYRYKPEKPGLEAVAWYCPRCAGELHRETWDTERELPQEAYLRATSLFNGDAKLRTCKSCNAVHPPVDATASKWAEIAAELRAELGGVKQAPTGAKLDIERHPTKRPLHQNVYWVARMANAQLVPIFPYLDPGSIVPCISLFYGGPGTNVGHFVHYNTVDEVVVNFGSVLSYIKPGIARVGVKTHGVGSFDTADPPEGMGTINVITQRHPIGEAQREAIIFICQACKHEIVKREYDGNPHASPDSSYFRPALPTLATIIESAQTSEEYNARAEGAEVKCPKCGAANHVFPSHMWAWEEYRKRTRTTLAAIRSLADAVGRAGDNTQKTGEAAQ